MMPPARRVSYTRDPQFPQKVDPGGAGVPQSAHMASGAESRRQTCSSGCFQVCRVSGGAGGGQPGLEGEAVAGHRGLLSVRQENVRGGGRLRRKVHGAFRAARRTGCSAPRGARDELRGGGGAPTLSAHGNAAAGPA